MKRLPVEIVLLAAVGCSGLPRATAPASAGDATGDARTGVELVLMNSIGMRLVFIAPGEFLMGSPPDEEQRQDHETQHLVRLTRGFYMGATEVTQKAWQTLMGNNPSFFVGDDLPVETVTWDDAVEFCRRLSEKEGARQTRWPSSSRRQWTWPS